MPLYTLKNKNTNKEWNVNCSYNEMKAMLNDETIRIITPPNFSSTGGATHVNSKTDDGWKDLLGRIKKGSGKGNTIKT